MEIETDDGSPGAGSCIFLHVWSGPDAGTAGCTAMGAGLVVALLGQLDPAARPMFVLLPAADAAALAAPRACHRPDACRASGARGCRRW